MTKHALIPAVLLCCFASPIRAHHSWGAEFDATKPITLIGVVTMIEWTNPHSYLHLNVKDANGNVVSWKLQGYPPGVLYRMGWRRAASIKVGDTVTVTGFRARDGTNSGHGRQVTLGNGQKLLFGPPAGTGDGGDRPVVAVK